jgi:uncharacterized cupredoxin-like copper-binding protein
MAVVEEEAAGFSGRRGADSGPRPARRRVGRIGALLTAVAVAGLIAAGCGSAKSASTSQTTTGGTAPGASGTKVTAALTEYHIALSSTALAPGTYTFVATNSGQVVHALEITGPGLHNATTADLQPGQSADLTVALQAGTYDVFCPVPGHKALGMNLDLKVTAG